MVDIQPTKVYLELKDIQFQKGEVKPTKTIKRFIGQNNHRCYFGLDKEHIWDSRLSVSDNIKIMGPHYLFWNPAEALYFKLQKP